MNNQIKCAHGHVHFVGSVALRDAPTVIQTLGRQFGTALNWPLGSAISMAILAIVLLVITISDRFERVDKKIPLLGDIPILGWAFRSTNIVKKKTN